MFKELKLKKERKININYNENSLMPNKQISESFSADGLECAHYSFVKGDLFSTKGNIFTFSASLDLDLETEENKNKLVFEIDIDHPFYFPLLHLLDNQNELVINDERENDEQKYLSIKNEEDLITLNFVDKNKNESLKDRFVILCLDKKNKINSFFDEMFEVLSDDYHQINFEEYTLKKKISEKERLSS